MKETGIAINHETEPDCASRWQLTAGYVKSALAGIALACMLNGCGGSGNSSPGNIGPTDTQQPGVPIPVPGGDADLCRNLVTDKAAHPMTALAKPGVGQSVIDPQFGTRITRLTDVATQFGSTVAKPAYSTIPAWNADESLLILYVTQGPTTGHVLFNGKTYAPIRALDIAPADIEHFYWSSTEPDVLFYPYAREESGVSLRQLIRYHVSSGQKEVIHDFPDASSPGAYRVDFGGDPIYGSYDNDIFGLRRRGAVDTAFTFKLSAGQESIRFPGDAPQISPSGRYFLDGGHIGNPATTTDIRSMKVKADEHGSMVRLANGQDVWASVQFDSYEGTLVTENLDSGEVKTVIGPATGYPYPPTGTHLSGHAFKAPGWVAVSVTGDPMGGTLLNQELLLADLNNGIVCRVAHHRSAGGDGPNGYWAEPHVNISPSGTRMIFGSDWGGGSTVDTYVVELPAYQR